MGRRNKVIFLYPSLSMFICISISLHFFLHLYFCIFLITSQLICVFMCMIPSLLYVSRVSTSFNHLGKILSGSAWVTCTSLNNIIFSMACRNLAFAQPPYWKQGLDFPDPWLLKVIPSMEMSWMAKIPGLRFLIEGAILQPSQPLSPAWSPDGITELEFSEDGAPLVCEHNDLLIHDDTLFPGVGDVITIHMAPWRHVKPSQKMVLSQSLGFVIKMVAGSLSFFFFFFISDVQAEFIIIFWS